MMCLSSIGDRGVWLNNIEVMHVYLLMVCMFMSVHLMILITVET